MGGGFSARRLERMDRVMAGYVERGEVPGVVTLVSRRGEVHARAYGTLELGGAEPVRRDSIFRVASISKPVAAVAAMILVEECVLRLDQPVDAFLPELAGRRVMARIDGPLDDTVPARRPITLRDLLTLRMGIGHLMGTARGSPYQQALDRLGLLQGPPHPARMPDPDAWIRAVGTLPLLHHPGERWLYDLGLDVLGVLVARAAGQQLEAFMRERIFGPLGMKDTGFSVAADEVHRLAWSYHPSAEGLSLYDRAAGGEWASPPPFPSAAGGLVSTADDYLAFGRMMLGGGQLGGERILSRPSVQLMTTDQVLPAQKEGMKIFLGDNLGWGFGMSVQTRRDHLHGTPGRFGWTGGLGTSWYCDPAEDLVGILLTQVNWTSPAGPPVHHDFWTCAYQAIGD